MLQMLAAHRLSSSPTALPGAEDALREAVARIVDPANWARREMYLRHAEESGYQVQRENKIDLADEAVEESLAKADAILALQSPRASDEVLGEASGAKCAGCGVSGHTWQDCPRNAANGVRANPEDLRAHIRALAAHTAPVADAQAKEGGK
jgi:hypothetical protein